VALAGGEASRRLTIKMNSIVGKDVTVILKSGTRYDGRLIGIDPSSLTLAMENAVRDGKDSYPLVIIAGDAVSEIILARAEAFDAAEFADFLAKYGGIPRHNIVVHEDTNVVEVYRSIRVSRAGVEGSGPLAQKIYTLYKEYMRRKGAER